MSIIRRSPVVAAAAALGLVLVTASTSLATTNLAVGTIVNFGTPLAGVASGACRQPEGLAVDPRGNLYAASNSDSATTVGHVCVLDPSGQLSDVIEVPAGAVAAVGLLGELWQHGRLLVLDQADDVAPHGRLLSIDPATHRVHELATGFAFPNAVVADDQGHLYVSDSSQGRVYRLSPDGRQVAVWLDSPLLRSTDPDLPVGANGMAFDRTGRFLYVANTGNRAIVRVPVRSAGEAGRAEVFADGGILDAEAGLSVPTALFGADGIQFDVVGNLYVMANHANEVQVLSPGAHLLRRYRGNGSQALDFNASAVFVGDRLYITNMSATDGGIGSKVSVMRAPYPGLLSR